MNTRSAPRESLSPERYYRDLIGSLGAIVWEADADTFQFTYVSSEAEKMLGYPAAAWTSRDFWLTIVHPEDRDRAQHTRMTGMREGRDSELEYRVVAAGGEVKWLLEVVRLVGDEVGIIRRMRGLMVDITARTRQEIQQQRFRNMVSHDLNNPLAGVFLNGDMLLRSAGVEGDDEARYLVGGILRCAEQLRHLVLDLSRGRAGDTAVYVNPIVVEAQTLVADAAAAARPLALDREVELSVSPGEPAQVRADPDRVQQVFGNLIANAIRYTPPGGTVRLTWQPNGDVVHFLVEDSGSGIPASGLQRLLDGNGSHPGLGLPIARRIVEAHGGVLTGRSQPGQGSTFTFCLPRVNAQTSGALGNPGR